MLNEPRPWFGPDLDLMGGKEYSAASCRRCSGWEVQMEDKLDSANIVPIVVFALVGLLVIFFTEWWYIGVGSLLVSALYLVYWIRKRNTARSHPGRVDSNVKRRPTGA